LQTLNEDLQGKLIAAEAECAWNAEVIEGYRAKAPIRGEGGKFASKKAARTAELAAYVAAQS